MRMLPYIPPVVIVLLLLIQLIPFLRARRMQGKPAPDIGDYLGDGYRGRERLMIYFFSPSCGMCKTMTPLIDDLAASHDNIVKVDATQALELARRFGVMGTPTTVLLRDGKVDRVLVGAKSQKQLQALLGE